MSSPLHWMLFGSKRQRSGFSRTPSLTPSSVSQGLQDSFMNYWILARWNETGRIFQGGTGCPYMSDLQVRTIVGWRAGDDAIEICRVHLRFFQSLAAAGRAAIPVIDLRRTAIKRRDDRLGLYGHFMHGAVNKVDQFFVMPKCEAGAAASVPSVSRRCGITALQRLSHGGVAD